MRILVVEDNVALLDLIQKGLRLAQLECRGATTIADATTELQSYRYAAMVLDCSLPDGDGLSLLDMLRRSNNPIPIVVLTARDTVSDRVRGLRAGADDYLTKPFAMDELVARVEAALRRSGPLSGRALVLANVMLEPTSREVSVGGNRLDVGSRSYEVLEALLQRAGKTVTKRALEDLVFGLKDDGSPNAIEVYVHRLRKQLKDAGATVEIHTVRGVGYVLSEHR